MRFHEDFHGFKPLTNDTGSGADPGGVDASG
jgi:hypothetical protein